MGKRAVAVVVCALLVAPVPARALEAMKAAPAPALDAALLQIEPARPEECYRLGWRGWGRYKSCSCVRCSWKLAPAPQRFCWRVC